MKEIFLKGGEKRFLSIIKDEYKDLSMDLSINIANKDRNTAEIIGKLNSVFRTLFTPGAIEVIQQNDGLGDLLNQIFETAGLSPVNFAKFTRQPEQPRQQLAQQAEKSEMDSILSTQQAALK